MKKEGLVLLSMLIPLSIFAAEEIFLNELAEKDSNGAIKVWGDSDVSISHGQECIFDRDTATFYAPKKAYDSWTGIHLTEPMPVSRIRYFGRSTNVSRMKGCLFQGANTEDFSDAVTLHTANPPEGWKATTWVDVPILNTEKFTYLRVIGPGPENPDQNGCECGNIAELEFYSISLPEGGGPAEPQISFAGVINGKVNLEFTLDQVAPMPCYQIHKKIGPEQYERCDYQTELQGEKYLYLKEYKQENELEYRVVASRTGGYSITQVPPFTCYSFLQGNPIGSKQETAEAFDGNIQTSVEIASGEWVGLDLNRSYELLKIKCVAGEQGLPSGEFQIADDPEFQNPTCLAIVQGSEPSSVQAISEFVCPKKNIGRYFRFVADNKNGSIAEIELHQVNGTELTWNGNPNSVWDPVSTEACWKDVEGNSTRWVSDSKAFFPHGGTIRIADSGIKLSSLQVDADGEDICFTGGPITFVTDAELIATNRSDVVIKAPIVVEEGLTITHGKKILLRESALPPQATLLSQDVQLKDLSLIEGIMSGQFMGPYGWGKFSAIPVLDRISSGDPLQRTIQFQTIDGQHTKCVKIKLVQEADGLYGLGVETGYWDSVHRLGYDLNRPGVSPQQLAWEGNKGAGYGLYPLTAHWTPNRLVLEAPITLNGKLTLTQGELTFGKGAVIGNGLVEQEIVNDGVIRLQDCASHCFAKSVTGKGRILLQGRDDAYSSFFSGPLTTEPQIVATNSSIANLTTLYGRSEGVAINHDGFTYDTFNFHWISPSEAEVDLQVEDDDVLFTKVAVVGVKQDGENIVAWVKPNYYCNGQFLGKIDPNMRICSDNVEGYQVKDLMLLFGCTVVDFRGGCSWRGGTHVYNSSVLLSTSSSGAIQNDVPVQVGNGGRIGLSVRSGQKMPITVLPGGSLDLFRLHTYYFYPGAGFRRRLQIEGGTVSLRYNSREDGANYLDDIDFLNGGIIEGCAVRLAYKEDADIHVGGNQPAEIRAGLRMCGNENQTIFFHVENVTDTMADLTLSGGFYGSTTSGVVKKGVGTLLYTGAPFYQGNVTVQEGALRFENGTAENPQTKLTLDGGDLDIGSGTNSFDQINLTKSSRLLLGTGSVHFLQTSDRTWDPEARLTVVGDLQEGMVRFGTSADALTANELSRISVEGSTVKPHLTREGYLVDTPFGTVMLLK